MIIYIDLLIITTVIVNYAFIKTISIIFNEKLNIYRVLISLLISVISLLLYLLPYKVYYSVRYLIGIPIGMIAFKTKNLQEKIIKITVYYFLNLAFIGTLFVFNVQSILVMLITVIYIVMMYIIQSYQNFNKKNFIYRININEQSLLGFLDTGNFSNYNNRPIVYIKDKYYNKEFKKIGMTIINSIDNNTNVDIYEGPYIYISTQKYQVYYAFVKDIPYDVILNHQMIGGMK